MAHALHPRWLSHDWFELHPRLKAELFKHVIALSITAFLLMVAVLLGLFEWAQVLPEQLAVTVGAIQHAALAQPAPSYTTEIAGSDQFVEQKRKAVETSLPEQF